MRVGWIVVIVAIVETVVTVVAVVVVVIAVIVVIVELVKLVTDCFADNTKNTNYETSAMHTTDKQHNNNTSITKPVTFVV